jgi:hypothetical protein
MKRILALTAVAAVLLIGCGSDKEAQPSARATNSAKLPTPSTQDTHAATDKRPQTGYQTPGAPAQPVTYAQAKTEVGSTGGVGDVYVHAHLDMGWFDHCLTNGQQADWASNNGGACYGDFKDGTEPFTGGRPAWSSWGKTGGRIIIGMATMHNSDNPDLSNVGISCYIGDRSKSDCTTDAGSHLVLTASSGDYILIRGMCKAGDPMCTPTRSPSVAGSGPEDAKLAAG